MFVSKKVWRNLGYSDKELKDYGVEVKAFFIRCTKIKFIMQSSYTFR